MTPSEWFIDITTLVGVAIALFTLIKGIVEFVKQGTQKRAEQFVEMRKRFKENEIFREISALLENDNPKLAFEPYKNKRDYLGFFEEIALMVNSGLIKGEVAYYMFGYYAIKCWKSDNFWKIKSKNGKSQYINRESQYWILFKKFVEKMMQKEDSFVYKEKLFRF